MYYVEQHPHFGLGNFINLTPALRWLARRDGPVPVYFNTPYVKECFLDCPFIRIIDKPEGQRKFGSELVCRANTMPDYAHAFQAVTGMRWNTAWHTYVDKPPFRDWPIDAVLVNGSGNERPGYVATKDPGPAPYKHALAACLKMGLNVVFVGSEQDLARNKWARNIAHGIGDIRTALALIGQARVVIANDTGLAHAAGAMGKTPTVLWVASKRPRVEPLGGMIAMPPDHMTAVASALNIKVRA